jgi:colicin import membrane protein
MEEAVARYSNLIQRQVERNWLLPYGSLPGLSCVLRITLTTEGKVLDVQLTRSSGDPSFDRSAIAAVRRASPLPVPPDPEVRAVFQSFNFKFTPGG